MAKLESAITRSRELVVRKLAEKGLQVDRKQRRRRLRKQLWRELQPWQKECCRIEKSLEDATLKSEMLLDLFMDFVDLEKVLALTLKVLNLDNFNLI